MATQAQELSCKELVKLLTEYLEGTLPPADTLRFDEHLAICEGCRIYLEQMRTTIRTLGRLREEFIPLQAKEDLLRVFRTWKA
jgi:predicted anti-sigma-YlaC factor YlaD